MIRSMSDVWLDYFITLNRPWQEAVFVLYYVVLYNTITVSDKKNVLIWLYLCFATDRWQAEKRQINSLREL